MRIKEFCPSMRCYNIHALEGNECSMITRKQLANMFDHTLLKPFATKEDFEIFCKDADENGFKMVAINSYPVKLCKFLLKDSAVHVGAAIGFPLGQTTIDVKAFEAKNAIDNGADEIDYVISITELKAGNLKYIKKEMEQIVTLCRKHGVLSKVIFENCFLTKSEIKAVALIAKEVKPDFIKTSTGYGTSGASIEDVILMRDTVEGFCQIKASGGIRDWAICKKMIEAGATRIGTSSSFEILRGFDEEMSSQINSF